jgi:hypothetical protein
VYGKNAGVFKKGAIFVDFALGKLVNFDFLIYHQKFEADKDIKERNRDVQKQHEKRGIGYRASVEAGKYNGGNQCCEID